MFTKWEKRAMIWAAPAGAALAIADKLVSDLLEVL